MNKQLKKVCKKPARGVAAATMLALSSQVNAFQLEFENPELSGFIDTTVSMSAAMALNNADAHTTFASGRTRIFNSSGDIYSSPFSVLSDIGLNYKDMGFFARVGYVYDFALMDGANKCSSDTVCNETVAPGTMDGLTSSAREEANRLRLYDFFVYKDFEINDHALSVRIGKQVVNWGESNIAGGGITQSINPVDLGKSTSPGSEVKERLLPQEMVYVNYEASDSTSVEAFYIWNWRKSDFFPVGTFFSPYDFQGAGVNSSLFGPTKVGTDNPDRGGQYGISVHTILEDFDEMDLGFYYTRTHAHMAYMQAFNNGTYRDVYAEDQDTYAISLNGEVGNTGISFQTELSYKPDYWDTRECRNSYGLTSGNVFPDTTPLPGCGIGAGDVTTFLGSLTYAGGTPLFGADKQAYVIDMVAISIDGLDSDNVGRPHADGVDQLDRPINDFGYGYTLVASYVYNNLFWDLNVNPVFVFKHDFEGNMPLNHANITEEQRIVKAGVTFEYQNRMSLNVGLTKWISKDGTFGDRDNVTATFKYSF